MERTRFGEEAFLTFGGKSKLKNLPVRYQANTLSKSEEKKEAIFFFITGAL